MHRIFSSSGGAGLPKLHQSPNILNPSSTVGGKEAGRSA